MHDSSPPQAAKIAGGPRLKRTLFMLTPAIPCASQVSSSGRSSLLCTQGSSTLRTNILTVLGAKVGGVYTLGSRFYVRGSLGRGASWSLPRACMQLVGYLVFF